MKGLNINLYKYEYNSMYVFLYYMSCMFLNVRKQEWIAKKSNFVA